MFHSMRYLGSSLFAKLVVVIIIIAFVFWGIGGDGLRQGGVSYAARVGNASISIAQFQQQKNLLDRQMQAMGVQGLDINKMDAAVLRQLIQQQLLVAEMQTIGLYVSEPLLAKTLRAQPQFTNPDGSFNADAFRNTLANTRITEGAFLDQLKQEVSGKFLVASLDMSDSTPPTTAFDLAAAAMSETRDVTLVTIPARTPADKMTDTAIKGYYEDHQTLYLNPQSRTLEYVTLAPGEMDAWIDKSIDADTRAAAAKADPSASPEKIAMQLRADARDAAMQTLGNSVEDALASGTTLGGAMTKLNLKASSHMLQNITVESAKTREDETEKTAIEQGLRLNDGEISGVITTPHGTTLMVAVKSVNAANPKPFETVATQVRAALAQQLAREDARSKAQEIKAALGTEKDVQAVLGKFNLYGHTVNNLPRPIEGKQNNSYGIPPSLQQAIFERKLGEVAGPLSLPNGDQMIAIVTELHHPKPIVDTKMKDTLDQALIESLNQSVQTAAFSDFVAHHPVKINPQLGNRNADASQ